MRSVGIDIGQYSIKVVEVLSTNKGVLVQNYFEQVLGTNPSLDFELEVLDFLQQLSQRYDPTTTRFTAALRQEKVSVHHKVFPFNDRVKINKSLSFEIEEDIPFSIDNAVLDAKITKISGHQAEVLAGAVPENTVRTLIKSFSDANIDLTVLSTEGFALCNLIEKWNEPPLTTQKSSVAMEDDIFPKYIHLVLDIGHTHTIATFFEGSTPIAIRTILWGGKNIAEAIAKKYELPYVEALKELQTKAFILTNKQGASWDQMSFSDTIAKSVQSMVKDLRLIMLELKSQFNGSFESMKITGGASQIINLCPFLTQQFEIPVNKISSLESYPNLPFERTPAVDATCSIALGLAIEGLKKPRNPAMNFLKGEFAKQNQFIKTFWTDWKKTVQFGAAALVILFIFASMRETASVTLSENSSEALRGVAKTTAKLSGSKATESNIKKYIREQKKRAQTLKSLSSVAKMNSAMDILKKISDSTPNRKEMGLEVSQLKIQDNVVFIEGVVTNKSQVQTLSQALSQVAENGQMKPETPGITPKDATQTPFAFSFKVDRNIQKVVR